MLRPSAMRHYRQPAGWTPEFPDDLKPLLDIIDEGSGGWAINPVTYLGKDTFRAVVDIVRGYGGVYVPADKPNGVKGHFQIPK